MAIYVDTSILARFVSPDDPHPHAISGRMAELAESGETFAFSPQAVRECWAVRTRPSAAGGYGLPPKTVSSLIADLNRVFVLVDDQPGIHDLWRGLVEKYSVSGKQVHDANHVATMLANGIEEILTLDARDFGRYKEVRVLQMSS